MTIQSAVLRQPAVGHSTGHSNRQRFLQPFASQSTAWVDLIGGQADKGVVLVNSPKKGRHLIANQELPAGLTLLVLPLQSALVASEGPEDQCLPWSVDMALQILRLRDDQRSAGGYQSWISRLPKEARLPISNISLEEVSLCETDGAICEAKAIQDMLRNAAEVLKPELAPLGAGCKELYWAASLAHSRSFAVMTGDAVTHIIAPGIDMANHSFEPTAFVRIVRSPDACQGADAVADVCEPSDSLGQDRVELIAGEGGIRAGQEITISYGQHPDEVFYLFYGFLPENNPANLVTLFSARDDFEAYASNEGLKRLTATARGWSEEGLQQISSWLGAEQLHDKKAYLKEDSSIRSMVSALDCLLARRSADVLQGYSTSMEADKVLLNQGGLSPAMELSIRFRYRQKKLLTHLSQKDG